MFFHLNNKKWDVVLVVPVADVVPADAEVKVDVSLVVVIR